MAGRKLNILVAGGYDRNDATTLERPLDEVVSFARALGREIIDQGHNVRTGCMTDLDTQVAEGARDRIKELGAGSQEIAGRIVSYVNQGKHPAHDIGSVRQSELTDWELGVEDLNPPENIRDADAVILIAGFRGTYRAANWARIEHKPLLPIAMFGGAAKKICQQECRRVDALYPGNVSRADYESVLRSLSTDWVSRARETVALAERLATSRDVFIVMSFKDLPEFRDVKAAITEACAEKGYVATRVDDVHGIRRIVPEIVRGIRQCAFVIADVTAERPNVYWELGLATGMNKDVIVIAKQGTKLPFDINDVPTLYWESFTGLRQHLATRIEAIARRQGRA